MEKPVLPPVRKAALLKAARHYHNAGLPLLPNHVTAKFPKGYDRWEERTFDLPIINAHINKGGALGLRTGAGIEAVDVDVKHWDGPDPDELRRQYEALVEDNAPGLLARLVIARTLTGGRHYLYRCALVEGNQKLAERLPTDEERAARPRLKAVTLIETRGEGGQVQIAPSPGYSLIQGNYGALPEISPDDRAILLGCARALNRYALRVAERSAIGTGERPGDHYNRNGGVEEALDLLLADGWSVASGRGETTYLTRPGGTPHTIHASYGHIAPGVFWSWSTDCSPFEPETAYSPFAVRAMLEHSGDFKACARELAKRYSLEKPAAPTPAGSTLVATELDMLRPRLALADKLGGLTVNNAGEVVTDPQVAAQALVWAQGAAHTTDLGNARRLVRLFGDRIRYVHKWATWFIWDGTRWAKDETGGIDRLARETVQAMYAEAAETEDSGTRKELARWAMSSESAGRLSAMVDLARSEPGIAVRHADLDTNPWLLNCANGTIDLRTGQLRAHNPSDLITKRIEVSFDPAATAPLWDRFLERITEGNTILSGFIQRTTGYSLTGDISEQCLFYLIGNGSNGKSTILEVLGALMGEYWQKANAEMLLQQRNSGGIPNDVARLPGARMVVSSELPQGRSLNESLAKDLTGGDTLSARFMRGEWFDFRPSFKLWIYGNHKLPIRGTDDGIWRRIRLIPLKTQVSEAEKDKDMPKKLQTELSGILAWAVRGCLAWQQEGLAAPAEVRDATNTYRKEMDVIGAFLAARCVLHSNARVPAAELYRAYVAWCEDSGEKALALKSFGPELDRRGYPAKRTTKAFMRQGLGLLAYQEGEGDSSIDDPMILDDPKSSSPHEKKIAAGYTGSAIIKDHRIINDHPHTPAPGYEVVTHGRGWRVTGPDGLRTNATTYERGVALSWQHHHAQHSQAA